MSRSTRHLLRRDAISRMGKWSEAAQVLATPVRSPKFTALALWGMPFGKIHVIGLQIQTDRPGWLQ